MVIISVAEYLDDEGQEVLLELCSGDVRLHAFCYPFKETNPKTAEKVILHALFAHNIGPCSTVNPPYRTSKTSFSYHIDAKILDIKERLVNLGYIDIILDSAIDSSFPIGSTISFDVVRLDY